MSLLPDWMDEPARKVSLFLEIEAASIPHLVAICSPEYGRSMKEVLELQAFDGAEVRFATHPYIPPGEDLCRIPHFGHDISCGGECESREKSVYRLFEAEAFVDAKPAPDIFGRYRIAEHVEVAISGRGNIVDLSSVPGYEDRQQVPVGRIGRVYDESVSSSQQEGHQGGLKGY